MSKILLIGYSTESTMSSFVEYLDSKSFSYDILDLCKITSCNFFHYNYSFKDLRISVNEDVFRFSEYDAFFTRGYYYDHGEIAVNRRLSDIMSVINGYLHFTQKRVINRPNMRGFNGNKFAHSILMESCGFRVPTTLTIGDSDLIIKLIADDLEGWVTKPSSGIRCEIKHITKQQASQISTGVINPLLIQKRIKGDDVRVHCVGEKQLPLMIRSSSVDYRYGKIDEYSPDIDIPTSQSVAMKQYQRRTGLNFIGFDFKISELDGMWYALEANPMPGFDFFDRRCDRKISQALLDLLIADDSSVRHKKFEEYSMEKDRIKIISPFGKR
ncbi:hypothetical protein IHN63_04380 [Deinococcus sp. 6YEL10]|uniref:ATP-grasp domain-containing protein n=1 Tax=Deinococcus sp. 6YEL10 TaxID=2745870 RepID=UPI001E5A1041|nr:hypothetical protein [Deinococcus sp. 6YEL10]MCD0160539.1 hypothetical protein [Deinococcus sp. 6YEL10]